MGFLKTKKKKKSDRDSNVEALAFVRENYASYGHMTVQNRAIPDFRDGLKPVHRRIIWTAYEERMSHFSKSARLVGVVLGKYHPHGDTAVYDSLVSMVHWPTPAFIGQGNWGDPVDGSSPAAMRYTECKLSKYSELALLDKEYLDCVPMHANYDGMETQPLYLPSLLPTLFLTGDMGVAVGVSVKYPAFTLKTLSKLITGALKSGKPVTAKQCAKVLEIDKAAFGGEELYNDTEYLELFKNTSSRLEFRPTHSISPKAREITVTSSAPGFNLPKSMGKFEEHPDVMAVENRSSRDGRKWVIRFKPSVAHENIKAMADSLISKFLSSAVTYIQAGTKRSIEDPTTDDTKSEFFYSTTVDLLNRWLEWRLQLERDMLKRRLANQRAALHKVNIVIKAAINAVALMKEISKKAPDLDKRIAKFLGITEEDAKIVLALQLRSMANLELSTLKKQRAAIKASINDTKARRKQPGASAAEKTGSIVSAMKL